MNPRTDAGLPPATDVTRAAGGAADACFLTLTHRGDIERFAILRRSIGLFAPDWPHIAVVNTEDRAAFERRFGAEPLLRIITTREVLPGWLERRRRKPGPGRHLRRWLYGRPVKGWYVQQLAKIFALASLPCEAAVFVDSDVFLCRSLTGEEFFSGGRVRLFRRRAANAEDLAFDISTHIVLGNPLHRVTELYDYIFSPASFRQTTAKALLAEFDRRRLSRRNRWLRRFIRLDRPSEYNLLGYAATVLEGCAGYALTDCEPDTLHHSIRFPEDRARLAAEIDRMCAQPKPFALIQSSLGIEPSVVAEVIERLAQRRPGAQAAPHH